MADVPKSVVLWMHAAYSDPNYPFSREKHTWRRYPFSGGRGRTWDFIIVISARRLPDIVRSFRKKRAKKRGGVATPDPMSASAHSGRSPMKYTPLLMDMRSFCGSTGFECPRRSYSHRKHRD